ncbi:MAG: Maf family protein [Beijerinckiaceae bacterium]
MPKLWLDDRNLILASASNARRQILRAAGVPLEVHPAHIDEREVEKRRGAGLEAGGLAALLAEAKAVSVSLRFPDRLILGSDQTLEFEGAILAKPGSLAEAETRLRLLSGGMHTLHSAYCFARNGRAVSAGMSSARMTMRHLTSPFIKAYVAACGESVLESVGCYQVEGLGVHLFEEIQGDWFTILGLPLGDVLAYLREECLLLT